MATINPSEPVDLLESVTDYPVDSILIFKGLPQHTEKMQGLRFSTAHISSTGYTLVIFGEDVTKQVKHDRQQVILENNLQTIINSSADIVIFIDPDLKISFVNKTAEKWLMKLTGKTFIKGDSFIDYLPVEKRMLALETLHSNNTKELQFEESIIFDDAPQRWLHVKCTAAYNDQEENTGFIIIAKDISERKEEELRIKKQNNQLREIAKIQSHELRRPLANIVGLVELLKTEAEKEVDKTLLTQLELSASNLDDVIKKITRRTVIA